MSPHIAKCLLGGGGSGDCLWVKLTGIEKPHIEEPLSQEIPCVCHFGFELNKIHYNNLAKVFRTT